MNISTSILPGRGAALPIASQLAGAFRSLWQATERFGQRRAANQLEMLALQYRESNPALAQHMRQAAAECRAEAAGTGQGARS